MEEIASHLIDGKQKALYLLQVVTATKAIMKLPRIHLARAYWSLTPVIPASSI